MVSDLEQQPAGAPAQGDSRPHRRRGFFLDRDAILRLVGAVLAEQTDEWADQHRYVGTEILADCRRAAAIAGTATPDTELPALAAGSM